MRHSTNPWVVLVLICFAQFMVILDATKRFYTAIAPAVGTQPANARAGCS